MARAYRVSSEKLNDWLEELKIDTKGKKILSPKIIRALIEEQGEPNWENLKTKKAS